MITLLELVSLETRTLKPPKSEAKGEELQRVSRERESAFRKRLATDEGAPVLYKGECSGSISELSNIEMNLVKVNQRQITIRNSYEPKSKCPLSC